MGALQTGNVPAESQWASGILEMTDRGFGGPATPRRLILRDSRANPDRGLLLELYQPTLVDVHDAYLRFRGIEPVALGGGQQAAMVQEWLVRMNV
jgi:hypothetical protein